MSEAESLICVNCQRGESTSPLVKWRYQGQEHWICVQCMPRLIHHTADVLGLLPGHRVPGRSPLADWEE